MDTKDLTFTDFIKNIEGDLGKTEWITVFEFFDSKCDIDWRHSSHEVSPCSQH